MYTSPLCCSAVGLVRNSLERATPHSLPIHHGSVRNALTDAQLKPIHDFYMSRKYGVAPQTNEAATYHSNMYTSSLCCSAVRLVRVTLERATPHSLPIHHGSVRSGPVQASPAICPCKRRCLPFAKQALPLSLNRNVAYWSSYVKGGGTSTGIQTKTSRESPLSIPPDR